MKVPLWLSEYDMYLVAPLYSVSATNNQIMEKSSIEHRSERIKVRIGSMRLFSARKIP